MRKPANSRAHLLDALTPVLDLLSAEAASTAASVLSMETAKQTVIGRLTESSVAGVTIIPSFLRPPRLLDRPSVIRKYGEDAISAIDQMLENPEAYGVVLEGE